MTEGRNQCNKTPRSWVGIKYRLDLGLHYILPINKAQIIILDFHVHTITVQMAITYMYLQEKKINRISIILQFMIIWCSRSMYSLSSHVVLILRISNGLFVSGRDQWILLEDYCAKTRKLNIDNNKPIQYPLGSSCSHKKRAFIYMSILIALLKKIMNFLL